MEDVARWIVPPRLQDGARQVSAWHVAVLNVPPDFRGIYRRDQSILETIDLARDPDLSPAILCGIRAKADIGVYRH